MERALRDFAAIVTDGAIGEPRKLDWSRIGFAEAIRARNHWVQNRAPAGAKVRLAAVRGVLRAAWRMGAIDADRYMRAIDLPPIRGHSLPVGRSLSQSDLEALFDASDDGTQLGVRDCAIVALLRCGMRAQELCALRLRDYVPAIGEEYATIRIEHGKGNKSRYAYLDEDADSWVRRWIDLRGDAPGALVCPADRKIDFKPLRRQGINKICTRRAKAAGIAHFSPHDMRRTTATELKEAGVDLSDIREVLGHRDIATTERYFHNDKELAKRRAALALKTPRGGRK